MQILNEMSTVNMKFRGGQKDTAILRNANSSCENTRGRD